MGIMTDIGDWQSHPELDEVQSLYSDNPSSTSAKFESFAPDLFDPSKTEVEIWTMTIDPIFKFVKVKAKSTEALEKSLEVAYPRQANKVDGN